MSSLDRLLDDHRARVHLVGCGGAGMRALGEVGRDLGWTVSGSDAVAHPRTFARLAASGIGIHEGHSAANLGGDIGLVVHSPAVPVANVEREAARGRLIPEASYPEMLGAISRRWPTIAVTGTHGKSTTTGLIGSILTESGDAAVVVCGAEVLARRRHGWTSSGRWAVVEACEYRKHFLEIEPEIAVVLGIEPDHFDCYPAVGDAIAAYRQFLERTRGIGLALVSLDTEAAGEALGTARLSARVETMSTLGRAADWSTEGVLQADGLELTVCYRGRTEARLSVPLLGAHHAANVLAAYAACRTAGAAAQDFRGAFAGFQGLARRLERFPDWRGVQRFDDYAHHPTAVAAVLRALGDRCRQWSGSRVMAVFQPHQISRTERLAREFGAALSLADEAWVVPVYAAREGGGRRAEELAREVVESVPERCGARFVASLDHALMTLETALRPGDIFVTLGAGDIDSLQYELPRRFP